MPTYHNTAIQTAEMQAVITEAGANALGYLYNGTQPANGDPVTGGNTLIAEVTFGATLGTASGGVLTFGAITGDTSANASGTPTFIEIRKSDGTTLVARYVTAGFPACTAGLAVDITGMTVSSGNVG